MKPDKEDADNMDTVDIKEASALLGVHPRTVARRVKQGRLSPLPKPRGYDRHHKLQFRRADVLALLDGG